MLVSAQESDVVIIHQLGLSKTKHAHQMVSFQFVIVVFGDIHLLWLHLHLVDSAPVLLVVLRVESAPDVFELLWVAIGGGELVRGFGRLNVPSGRFEEGGGAVWEW